MASTSYPDAYLFRSTTTLDITAPGALETDELDDGMLLAANLESGLQHAGPELAVDGGSV